MAKLSTLIQPNNIVTTGNTGTAGQVLFNTGVSVPMWNNLPSIPTNLVTVGNVGTTGQVLVNNGASDPLWTTFSGGATVADDTTTNANYYPTLSTTTSGTYTTAKVSSTKLYFNPSTGILAAPIFQSSSDIALKENVVTASSDVISQLRGVEFTWIENGKKSSGVIAQELEKVLPHLVEQGDSCKTVNYSGLVAYLIESVKSLKEEIELLKSKGA